MSLLLCSWRASGFCFEQNDTAKVEFGMPLPAIAAVATTAAGFMTTVLTAITTNVSPWMVVGVLINYASNIQSYKKAASLFFQVPETIKC